MTRIKILFIVFTICALATACGVQAKSTATPPPQALEPLVLYDWAGYMPQSILDSFTEEYGIPIQYVIYGDQDEALNHMRAGELKDEVVLGNMHVPVAVAEDLLAPLDYTNIPNFRNISPNFRELAYDPENQYSIMIQWGTTGIVVRSDHLNQPVTGWDDLWNPQYAGRIGIWPYSREIIGITLKTLGYELNSQDPDELREAEDKLLLLRDNVFLMDATLPSGVSYLLDDSAVMIHGWSYDAMEAQAQFDDAVYILPKEGTILWSDNVTISANSKHKQTAELFINYLLRPEISAIMVNELWVPSPNEAALPFIQPEILNNPAIYPSNESLAQAEFYEGISDEAQSQYDQIWERFLAREDAVSLR